MSYSEEVTRQVMTNCDETFSQLFFPLKNLDIRKSAEAEMKSARIN